MSRLNSLVKTLRLLAICIIAAAKPSGESQAKAPTQMVSVIFSMAKVTSLEISTLTRKVSGISTTLWVPEWNKANDWKPNE